MEYLKRDPTGLSGSSFDVVVVGGGIYGAMMLLEATRAGYDALLLEQNDFGSGTSSNHFQIGHGGLRYLQSLNFTRFRRSVRERRWLCRHFPDLVRPLRCVMPLYGDGLRRPWVMKVALALNDVLSADRNRGVPPEQRLDTGEVITASRTEEFFPVVSSEGLKGAAVWYDCRLEHSNRVLIEALMWAVEQGGRAQNYTEVTDVTVDKGEVAGVVARDRTSDSICRYAARHVINATGPWSREFARCIDRDYPGLFRKSRAWNVMFDRSALGEGALAVKARGRGKQTLFLQSRAGKLFVGTGHATCGPEENDPFPSDKQLSDFVGRVNEAVPELRLQASEIMRVFAGFLPVTDEHSVDLLDEPVIVNHGGRSGPSGLYSVSGVKYTTARHVAEAVVDELQSGERSTSMSRRKEYSRNHEVRSEYCIAGAGADWLRICRDIIEREAVVHLDDLVLRRTDLGDYPRAVKSKVRDLLRLFDWTEDRKEREVGRLFEQIRMNAETAG